MTTTTIKTSQKILAAALATPVVYSNKNTHTHTQIKNSRKVVASGDGADGVNVGSVSGGDKDKMATVRAASIAQLTPEEVAKQWFEFTTTDQQLNRWVTRDDADADFREWHKNQLVRHVEKGKKTKHGAVGLVTKIGLTGSVYVQWYTKTGDLTKETSTYSGLGGPDFRAENADDVLLIQPTKGSEDAWLHNLGWGYMVNKNN